MAPLDYNISLDRLAGWWAINTFYERSSYEYIRVGSGEVGEVLLLYESYGFRCWKAEYSTDCTGYVTTMCII